MMVRLFVALARCFVGLVLVCSAVEHFKSPFFFLSSIFRYDVLPGSVATVVAAVLPCVQLVVGVAMILNRHTGTASLLAAGCFLVFMVAQATVLVRGLEVGCGCFGTAYSTTISWITIGIVGCLLLISLAISILSSGAPRSFRSILNRNSSRRGVTLIELLVVIAMIGVMVSLLMPAISMARSRARSLQCLSQVRQQALAAQSHLAAHHQFPTGGWGVLWLGVSDRGFDARQPGGPFYNVLPYMDHQPIHEMAPEWNEFSPSILAAFAAQAIPILLCPERGSDAEVVAGDHLNFSQGGKLKRVAPTDYAFNGGASFYTSVLGPVSSSQAENGYNWPNVDANGICFLRSEIRPADVRDGMTHVILVGEKWVPSSDDLSTVSLGYNQPHVSGDCLDVRRFTISAPARDNDSERGSASGFGSSHLDGAAFAFCDGSARVIPYWIDPLVFKSYGHRFDGTLTDAAL